MKAKEINEEFQSTNVELLRGMISISNNSRLTQDCARMLSDRLDRSEINELLVWIRHANREISTKISQGRRF